MEAARHVPRLWLSYEVGESRNMIRLLDSCHGAIGRQYQAVLVLAILGLAACGGGGGSSGTQPPPLTPSVSVNASPATVLSGSFATLTWSSTNASACAASGAWSGARPTAGSEQVGPLTQSATYSLSCSGAGSTSASASTSVTVTPPVNVSLKSRTLDFASDVRGIVPDLARGRIYLAAYDRNQVLVVSNDTLQLISRHYVGQQPGHMIMSLDGSRLYIGLTGAVAVVDLDTFAVTRHKIAMDLDAFVVGPMIEVRPGELLISGGASAASRLITLDVATGARRPVASGATFAWTVLIASPDQAYVYVAGGTSTTNPGRLLKLDARQADLPVVTSAATPNGILSLAVNRDGTQLIAGGGAIYDAATLARLTAGSLDGTVAATTDGGQILQAPGATVVRQLDPSSFGEISSHPHDCTPARLTGLVSLGRDGQWALNQPGMLCVVSMATPTTPPGVDADRRLPSVWPDSVLVPFTETAIVGAVDVALDEPRGVVYLPIPVQQQLAIYSLQQIAVVQTLPMPGSAHRVQMSADGERLYIGFREAGRVAAMDLTTRQIVASVDVGSLLGPAEVWDMVEVAPMHLLISALAQSVSTTYIVEVFLDNPGQSRRVGCTLGYGSTGLQASPDRRFLMVATNRIGCPLFAKWDLTVPGFPTVLATSDNNQNNLGRTAVTIDGSLMIGQDGHVIDTDTLWPTALSAPGVPMGGSTPDRFYVAGGQSVVTVRTSDFAVTSIAQSICQSVVPGGVNRAVATADGSRFLVLGSGGGLFVPQALCVLQSIP